MQRIQKFALRVKAGSSKLPAAEPPSGRHDLKGHNGHVSRVAALPESGLIATACWAIAEGASSALCIFLLDGDSEPLHTLDLVGKSYGLVAVGSDVVACGGEDAMLTTCHASTGERLETLQLESRSAVTAMAAVGDGVFVTGCANGTLFSLAHSGGRNLRVVAQYKSAHTDWIRDVAVCGDVFVTASDDKTAAVWSAATQERLDVLRGHGDVVNCPAICERFIATGSDDKSIRIYENKGSYSLVRVLEGIHADWVWYVDFVGEDLLMSASRDGTLAFTSLSTGKPMAHVYVGLRMLSAAILPDGRLACVGYSSGAAIISPPSLVADEVKRHAATVSPRPLDLSIVENEPLQSAMIEVCAGRFSAGEACRKLVMKENCSRSVEEWGWAHCLLMAAVRSEEIPGELHVGTSLSHWYFNLYSPSRCLALAPKDLKTVKRCAYEAQRAGVLSEPEALFAAVEGGQDLSREVEKFQKAGQGMLHLLSQVLVAQAETDDQMKMMGKEIARQARNQKVNALLAAVFSFAPLGGALAANAIGAAAEALPLAIESMVSTGVGIQGAATPTLLDKFIFRAEAMISLEGWERVTPENRVAVREAAEGPGMSWEVFCGMVRDAAAARRNAKTCLADDDAGEVTNAEGSAQGPSGELIASVEDTKGVNAVVDRNGDGDGHDKVLGAQVSVGSTIATGLTLDSSASEVGSTLSHLQMTDGEGLLCMTELKAAAWDTEYIMLMNGDALSKTVAAVMVNFDGDLYSVWRTLAECLRVVFGVTFIGGDMVVGYPQVKLHERVVAGLRGDAAYRDLGAGTSSFEWRLEQYLRGFRLTNR